MKLRKVYQLAKVIICAFVASSLLYAGPASAFWGSKKNTYDENGAINCDEVAGGVKICSDKHICQMAVEQPHLSGPI